MDPPRIERAVREVPDAVGEDPDREGLRDTPTRVARAYEFPFAGLTVGFQVVEGCSRRPQLQERLTAQAPARRRWV